MSLGRPGRALGQRVLRVAIFEQDQLVAELLENLLKFFGHESQLYTDPDLCSLYAHTECCCPQETPCADVLLINADLPGRQGIEFLRQQRDRGCKAPLANIALIGHLTPEQIKDADENGYRYFLFPFTTAEIVRWLNACWERKTGYDRGPSLSSGHSSSDVFSACGDPAQD